MDNTELPPELQAKLDQIKLDSNRVDENAEKKRKKLGLIIGFAIVFMAVVSIMIFLVKK